MLGGIAFQFGGHLLFLIHLYPSLTPKPLCLVVIIVFSTLAIDFVQRYVRDQPTHIESSRRGVLTPRLKFMLTALAFSTTTLFIR